MILQCRAKGDCNITLSRGSIYLPCKIRVTEKFFLLCFAMFLYCTFDSFIYHLFSVFPYLSICLESVFTIHPSIYLQFSSFYPPFIIIFHLSLHLLSVFTYLYTLYRFSLMHPLFISFHLSIHSLSVFTYPPFISFHLSIHLSNTSLPKYYFLLHYHNLIFCISS